MITLKEDEWTRLYDSCKVFAENEYETTGAHRRKRYQSNPKRVKMQTADGKMGEWLVTKYLKSMGLECSEPDMEIYKASKKSFDADLYVGEHHLHCKTQNAESAQRYGISWVFQAGSRYGSRGHSDPIVGGGDGLAVFVKLDPKEYKGTICGPFKMEDLRPHFKDPVLKHLKGIKTCLYWKDISELSAFELEERPVKRSRKVENS